MHDIKQEQNEDEGNNEATATPEEADNRHQEATATQWRSSRSGNWNSWWSGDGWGNDGKAKFMKLHPGGDWSGGGWKSGGSSWKGSWEGKDDSGGGIATSKWNGGGRQALEEALR